MRIVHGDFFRSIANHILDDREDGSLNPQKVKSNDLIFIKTDYIHRFFSEYYPKIQNHFRIITHNSDCHIGHSHAKYLNMEKLVKWYAQNNTLEHPKMVIIPIGVANPMWLHGNQAIMEEVLSIEVLKEKLLYVNFNTQTNPSHRIPIWNSFSTNSFTTKESNVDFRQYLINMKKHHFVLSPLGNGNDCHRNYEAIFLGVIPIILDFPNANELYRELPVMIVESFADLSEDLLISTKEHFNKHKFTKNKVYGEYWKNLIANVY